MCVDAFHGYMHNYACQDQNHSNGIEGTGLKDFGTMEHIFSSSNQLASVICYASAYKHRLFIDAFFTQWDKDRYLNLGQMLYKNYVQALKITTNETLALDHTKQSLGIVKVMLKAIGSEGLWPQLVRCAPFLSIALYFTKARLSRPKVPDV
jgi:hypothetical protein